MLFGVQWEEVKRCYAYEVRTRGLETRDDLLWHDLSAEMEEKPMAWEAREGMVTQPTGVKQAGTVKGNNFKEVVIGQSERQTCRGD